MSDQLSKITEEISFDDNQMAQNLFGAQGSHLRLLEEKLNVTIFNRGNEVKIQGNTLDVETAISVLQQVYQLIEEGFSLSKRDWQQAIYSLQQDPKIKLTQVYKDGIKLPTKKQMVYPRTAGQRDYLLAMRKNDIVFGVGPAGTGKTYMAVAMGLHYFFKGEIKKIILTRPAIEAGERLGFLPGDLVEKVNPYLRPLYDALHDMIDIERAERMIDKGEIEIAPLAFMRGRTLNDAYVILDEAQNATKEQMKMFLTRLGFQSKCIVTGDTSQVDLPRKTDSGLFDAINRLRGIEGISIHQLTSHDVVRHYLVQKIIEAYDNNN